MTDRQTDRHFIRSILAHIIIHNGLQYITHDSGCMYICGLTRNCLLVS